MNLRELTQDQENILAQVESGDFSLDDVSDHLDMLDSERNKKIESYLHVINRLETQLKTKTDEIKRIEILRDANFNALSRVKEWLLMSMKDGEKHEFDLFKVSRVKGREGCSVLNQSLIPAKFINTKEIVSVDKRELLKQLKLNPVNGAELITGKSSLRIK